jgi:hypothetical protein
MPIDIQSIIDYTKIYQDIELASGIGELKKDPKQLALFLQNQQDNVFKNVVKQKEDTFQKVYGDLNRAGKSQESVLLYNLRNKQLADVQEQVYTNQKHNADAVTEDKSMANRKNEMNEWTVNNKKDTLFVFSSLFLMLSGLTLITVLYRMSLISPYLWSFFAAFMVIIFTIIVVRRSQYTNVLRDKRYWNKQIFPSQYGQIQAICPGLTSQIQSGINSASQSMNQGIATATQGLATAAAGASQGLASASQELTAK